MTKLDAVQFPNPLQPPSGAERAVPRHHVKRENVAGLVWDDERRLIRVRFALKQGGYAEVWASASGCIMYLTPEDAPSSSKRRK